mmetsp:Transcript_20087/g.43456  ORF Transcript_20087/g.43456 Transcript_20087/m.43456 type:complete len:97 (-) Transcript_20087:47-337(-)
MDWIQQKSPCEEDAWEIFQGRRRFHETAFQLRVRAFLIMHGTFTDLSRLVEQLARITYHRSSKYPAKNLSSYGLPKNGFFSCMHMNTEIVVLKFGR